MRRKTLRKIFQAFMTCFSGYCEISHLHGFRNITRANIKWYESTFWLMVCTSAIFLTISMFFSVWHRYQLSPIITTIETSNFPVAKVPFPAVTLCNLNKILKSSFESLAKKFEEEGVDRSLLEKYLAEIFQMYYYRGKKKFRHEEVIKKAMDNLGYNLESLIYDLSQPCSQFLVRCFWSGKSYDCSSLFEEVKTLEGFCCTFNWRGGKMILYGNHTMRKPWKKEKSLFHHDEKYLFINDANTLLKGLTIVVDPDEDNYFISLDSIIGSMIMLHDASEYPDLGSRKALIESTSQAIVRLRADVVESSNNVRSVKLSQRQCYFDGELSTETGARYSYEACNLKCMFHTHFKMCGCVPYYYQNVTGYKICDFSGMKCVIENRVLGSLDNDTQYEEWDSSHGNHCGCLPSCNDIKYDWSVEVNQIRNPKYASPILGDKLGSKSIINVFFEQNVCIKYRIESLITWDTLIASFGGILGLCLGGSIISLIEIPYYFLYNYGKCCRKEMNSKAKRNRRNKVEWIKVNHRVVERSHWNVHHSLCHQGFLPWTE